ncbi:MAG: SDR family NAD(P)-dependent oxidoreductase [Nitrospinota bacterium]
MTAASKGLGKATALGLAREGAKVALCSRDRARIEAAAREVTEAGGGPRRAG